MIYDTAGKLIYDPIFTCNCGTTSGCNQCRPSFIGCISDKEAGEMKKKIEDWKKRFDEDFNKRIEELDNL